MPSPLPGMNPYLESPALWSEVHSWLIVELARLLNPLITPKYRAAVEKRVYDQTILIGVPDVSVVRQSVTTGLSASQGPIATLSQPMLVELPESEATVERYLEIHEVATNAVVTVIEVLSPKNKRAGEGRSQYLNKRTQVLNSRSHLIELDLLRKGEALPLNVNIKSNYRVLVSRVSQRPAAELYAFNLRDSLPCFPVPLQAQEPEPRVDLKQLLDIVYESAALDLTIDYQQPPVPRLSQVDWAWVQEQLHNSL